MKLTINSIQKYSKISIIYISLIILTLDLIFVAINYFSTKEALYSSLLQRAQSHQTEFNLSLEMTYRNMLQMSTFISQNDELNQLFLKGKKAIEQEGGGSGKIEAEKIRQELLRKIKPSWDHMTQQFDIRQLHYQLGPGSLSFLRVHKPHKFGDRMDNIRHTIVDTNTEKTPRVGFETGRIYSGLRGVSPVWTIDPETKEKIYVGALEVGTSFEQILPIFATLFKVETAILLTKSHVQSKMWSEFIEEYFHNHPDISYYLEATSSPDVKKILPNLPIDNDYATNQIKLIKEGSQYFSVYYHPLRDYQGTRNNELPPVGFILQWEDVSSLFNSFITSVITNIIYAVVGFIIIEIGLIWAFNRETRLAVAEQNASIDGLTGIFNRRYFDTLIKNEMGRAKRNTQPLSLIVLDIDFFKNYNDSYGHQAGDECLRKIANTLKLQVRRSSDFVARYGGEEFVIVLPQTDLNTAVNIANTTRHAISSLNIPHANSQTKPFVTISLGVACTNNLDGDNDLFKVADQNLYIAKNTGRNKVEPSKKCRTNQSS